MTMPDEYEHYKLLRRDDGTLWELGRGAMGVTYKAWHTTLDCPVALKIIHPSIVDSLEVRSRFQREARAAAKLIHPNIATAHHLGKTPDGGLFYVMEFCDGPTLHESIATNGTLKADEALEVAFQVAKALIMAESHGIVHRDIKPANLILTRRPDEGLVVKVIDFGLARIHAPASTLGFTTQSGMFLGTAHFASPEQVEERPLDIRSDFYALGACVWFMLTGGSIFMGSLQQILTQVVSASPPWDRLADQPAPLLALLQRLLAKRADERPATAILLRNDIAACLRKLGELDKTAPPAPPEAVKPPEPEPVEESKPVEAAESQEVPGPPATEDLPPAPPENELVLGRFLPGHETGRDSLGAILTGSEEGTGRPVRLRLFDSASISIPDLRKHIELRCCGLRDHPHATLPEVLASGGHAGGFAVATVPIEGISLVDVLKARSALPPQEALLVLESVAAAHSHAEASGFGPLEVHLGDILATTQEGPPATEKQLRQPLDKWGGCRVTVDALNFTREALRQGLHPAGVPGGTMVHPVRGPGSDGGMPGAGVQAARLFHELVGGTTTQSGHRAPLADLNEAANHALRRALDGGCATASEVVELLRPHVNRPAGGSTAVAGVTPPTLPEMDRKRRPLAAAGFVVVACVAALALVHPWNGAGEHAPADDSSIPLVDQPARPEPPKPKPEPAPQPAAQKPTPPITVKQPDPTPPAAVMPAAPAAAPAPVVPTPPPPMPEDRIKAFVRQAVQAEDSHELDAIIARYADKVDYFGDAQMDRSAVRSDKEKYFLRWTKTLNTIKGGIAVVAEADGSHIAAYTLGFRVDNALGEWMEGESEMRLHVMDHDGALSISGEEAQVTIKAKGGILEDVIRELVSREDARDLDAIMSRYDSQVEYFDRGMLTNEAIRAMKQEYFQKWPDERHTIHGGIKVTHLPGDSAQVEFVTSFNQVSNGRAKRRECVHFLILLGRAGKPVIIQEWNEPTR